MRGIIVIELTIFMNIYNKIDSLSSKLSRQAIFISKIGKGGGVNYGNSNIFRFGSSSYGILFYSIKIYSCLIELKKGR